MSKGLFRKDTEADAFAAAAARANGPLLADFVEEVGVRLRRMGSERLMSAGRSAASRWLWRRHRDELGELPEVLGGGCEVELVTGAIRAS